jgi:serine/threonine-protein kinase RsbW
MATSLANGALTLSVPNSLQGLKDGLDGLSTWLKQSEVGLDVENRALLVFEEIVTNIMRYGFDDSVEHKIEVVSALSGDELRLTFDDEGRPFDPVKAPAPQRDESLATARIGGRGIFLVRKAAKHLDYERTPRGHNRLTVVIPRS